MLEIDVAITGIGLLTPLGGNVEENRQGLVDKRTGIACYPGNSNSNRSRYLGKVTSFQPAEHVPGKLLSQMRFLNRGALLGFGAAREAINLSGIDQTDVPNERKALYVASGDLTKVGYDFMYPAMKEAADEGWDRIDREKLNTAVLSKVNPFFLLESISNNPFSFLSAFGGFMGPNTSLASLSPCGAHALELGYRAISRGEADVALVAGCGNWNTEVPLFELEGLGILSQCKDGPGSFRPFDRRRDGFIPGEGGAALVLEPVEKAILRNANILAKIRGFGNCIDMPSGPGLTVPSRVTRRSMEEALEEAACDPGDLAFVSPHGSATSKGDKSELRSIVDVFGRTSTTGICGLKPYTGHMAAASDVAEIALGIMALSGKMVPATLNFGSTQEEFKDLAISESHQHTDKRLFMSTSYGIMGESSSAIIEVVDP